MPIQSWTLEARTDINVMQLRCKEDTTSTQASQRHALAKPTSSCESLAQPARMDCTNVTIGRRGARRNLFAVCDQRSYSMQPIQDFENPQASPILNLR